MFLRKLFSTENKIGWVFVDLVIVIIGVYGAYLIQSYGEERAIEDEQEKVLTALKFELETFRIQLPHFAQFMDGYTKEISNQNEVDFSNWRYIEPQYAYQIVEYAIELENNSIIDFELYDHLQKLYVSIKQLEHVEQLITHHSGLHKQLIPELARDHPNNLSRLADNRSNFDRFYLFVSSRGGNLRRVAQNSQSALVVIDENLGLERSKEIERQIILTNAGRFGSIDEAVQMATELFPKFTETELRDLLSELESK